MTDHSAKAREIVIGWRKKFTRTPPKLTLIQRDVLIELIANSLSENAEQFKGALDTVSVAADAAGYARGLTEGRESAAKESANEIVARLRKLADSMWTDAKGVEAERQRQNYSLLHDAAYLIARQDVFLHHWETYGAPPAIRSEPPATTGGG